MCYHISDLAEQLDEPAAFLTVPPTDMTLRCAPIDQEVRMVWDLDASLQSRGIYWDGISMSSPGHLPTYVYLKI